MFVGAALALVAVLTSKLAARLGVPVVVLFLAVGMLAGSDGPGDIAFDDYGVARSVGIVALAYILFAGGLDTRWSDVRGVLAPGLSLATVGVVVTAVVTGAFASWVLDFTWEQGLLLGAIVSSTDAAAVFSVLRSRGIRLRGRTRHLLELESGSNDPMAVFLTLGFLDLATSETTSGVSIAARFVAQMSLGLALGWLGGVAAVWGLNRLRLEYDGLYPAVTITAAALVYASTALVGGSGFLAVYVAGLVLGNANVVHRRSLTRFHDAIAWLMQIAMFLVLGLLVFPSDLPEIALRALAVTAVLLLLARPLAVFVSLIGTRFELREKVFFAWVGLRGAVPIVLATFPEAEGLPEARTIFDVVFFVVLTSILVDGTTIVPLARALRLEVPETASGSELERAAEDVMREVVVAPGSRADGRTLVDLALPPGVLVVLVARGGAHEVPQGSTVLHAGDRLLLLAGEEALAAVQPLFSGT
ncbi:MAG: K+/H+ antiporter [Acidimicrobiia bacterium]|nr:MAG: K+/H+ antiporter [Acidimicrobiia bacterium]